MGNYLGSWKKPVLQIGIGLIFFVQGLALVSAILLQNILMCLIVLGAIGFTIYFFYVRLYQKKEAKYPLVPPEGKVDIYFPRTNIPRPIHGDFREMCEKKQRFDKIRRKIRRKKK